MCSRSLVLVSSLLAAVASAFAQGTTPAFTCTATSNPPVIAAEDVTARLGDVVLSCSGGTPGATANGNFALFLNVPVTNRISSENIVDAVLTVNTGSGETPSGVSARLIGTNQIAFNGVNVLIPAGGTFTLRVSNVRGDATRLGRSQSAQVIITSNGPSQFAISNPTLFIGLPFQSLFGTTLGVLTCSQFGSPVPGTLTLQNLLGSGSGFASTRVTEGFASAFHPRENLSDNGVRLMVRYTGLPSGARVFAPDVIAGSGAFTPTSAGDFGQPASPGVYTPGSPALVLSRVRDTAADGSGGTVLYTGAPGSPVSFGSYSEVGLSNGSGYAVYEVVDANASVIESAQIVSFLGLPRGLVAETVNPSIDVVLAPVSNTGFASASAPVVRFVGGLSGPDCNLLGDCNGAWVPRPVIGGESLSFVLPQGFFSQARFIDIRNAGGGILNWNATVQYKTGSGWLRVTPSSGINNGVIRVDALTSTLNPGKYEASLIIDAAIGGRTTLPVTVEITPAAATGQDMRPQVAQVINAATYAPGSLVAGSIGTIKGNFAGKQRVLAIDGLPANVLYADDRQINFIVPSEVGGRPMAQMVVTVDGTASAPVTLNLSSSAPGVFPRGILNQDSTLNEAGNPALAGTAIQVYATGLFGTPVNGKMASDVVVSGRIGNRVLMPEYAGIAPGIPGVQQVNFRLPTDLPAGAADLEVCAIAGGQSACAPAVKLSVRQ